LVRKKEKRYEGEGDLDRSSRLKKVSPENLSTFSTLVINFSKGTSWLMDSFGRTKATFRGCFCVFSFLFFSFFKKKKQNENSKSKPAINLSSGPFSVRIILKKWVGTAITGTLPITFDSRKLLLTTLPTKGKERKGKEKTERRREEEEENLVMNIKLSGLGVFLWKPEGSSDDIDITINVCELSTKLFQSTPIMAIESLAHLGANVCQVKGFLHGFIRKNSKVTDQTANEHKRKRKRKGLIRT